MNTHHIKLELTLGLLDLQQNDHILYKVGDIMKTFQKEVGSFKGLRLIKKKEVIKGLVNRTYKMIYDNCTVFLDLVFRDGKHYVNKFDVMTMTKIPAFAFAQAA